jgi:hypothetical protein
MGTDTKDLKNNDPGQGVKGWSEEDAAVRFLPAHVLPGPDAAP